MMNRKITGWTFSPDGTQLAVAVSWDVQIWDVDELLVFGVQ